MIGAMLVVASVVVTRMSERIVWYGAFLVGAIEIARGVAGFARVSRRG